MKKEDKTDPICGMKGHIKAHGKYFCNEYCIKKYEKIHKIKTKRKKTEVENKCCSLAKKNKWYKDKLIILIIITVLFFVLSYFYYEPLFEALWDYLKLIWWAILLGLLLGGFIDYYIPREYIQKFFATHRKRTIFYAVIFGFLMSACSHGILAIAMELYKKGASTSSTIAFLLASPWANLPITILFFGFFGYKAVFIVTAAIIIAIISGLIYQVLEKKSLVECDKCDARGKSKYNLKEFSIRKDISQRFKKYRFTFNNFKEDFKGVIEGSMSLTRMVLWWILIGMIVASLARTFVPQHFFMAYMGATFLGMVVVLILATIIEVCSEGSAPMAFEIYNQTGAFGNSFVFLSAGVATDYTEIGLIWSNIGKKAALWLPVVTVPQILIAGLLFNLLL